MSFSPQRMNEFSRRMQKAMLTLTQTLGEIDALDLIYVNEATSGAHADFTDADDILEAEFVDGINFGRDLATLIRGGAALADVDRTTQITPFIQGENASAILG